MTIAPSSTCDHRRRRTDVALVAVALCALGSVCPVHGASVEVKVSTREAVPGEAIELYVVVHGNEDSDPPQLPPMPGFTVKPALGNPSVRSSMQIINRRVTRDKSLTYTYALRPQRPGRLRIPSITVKAGGKVHKTKPIPIVVTKSETGDLLFVEFAADRESVYVEQPFELTLRIWVRPFKHRGRPLQAKQMWGLFSRDSELGPFAQQVRKGKFTVRSAIRKDRDGQEREYYLYQASQKVWPDKPGPYRPTPVTINMVYPVRLSEDTFGDLRHAAKPRRLLEQAKPPKIVVKPIPEEGRPPTYNGAIGRYAWKVWADRTDVRRGQLITLNMEISGEGRLDRVPAPPLAKAAELAKHFKVLDEQLAGEVRDDKKIFRQKIRATDDSVKAIPPIPLAFFDPDADGGKGRFVTVMSEPIPITVHAADTLTADEIVIPAAMGPDQSSILTEAADSIRANYGEAAAALASQVFAPGPTWAASLVVPPIVWLAGYVFRRRSDRLRTDVALARRRGARRSAEGRLRAAAGSDDPSGGVADALLNYIADRANLPAGGLTRADAVARLRDDGAPDETIDELDALLSACEEARYAGLSTTAGQRVDRGGECLKRLERTWRPQR